MKNLLIFALFSFIFSFFFFSFSVAAKTPEVTTTISSEDWAKYGQQVRDMLKDEDVKKQLREQGITDVDFIPIGKHLVIYASGIKIDHIFLRGENLIRVSIITYKAKNQFVPEDDTEILDVSHLAAENVENSQTISKYEYGKGLAMAYPMGGSKDSGLVSMPAKNELSGKEIITLVLILLIAFTDLISWGWRKDLRNQKEILAAQEEEETEYKLENLRNGNGLTVPNGRKLVLLTTSIIMFVLLGNQTFAKGGGKNYDVYSISSDFEPEDWYVIGAIVILLTVAIIFGICSSKGPKESEQTKDEKNTNQEDTQKKNIEPIEVQTITDTTDNSGAELSSA